LGFIPASWVMYFQKSVGRLRSKKSIGITRWQVRYEALSVVGNDPPRTLRTRNKIVEMLSPASLFMEYIWRQNREIDLLVLLFDVSYW
jgi:hypothetical protein